MVALLGNVGSIEDFAMTHTRQCKHPQEFARDAFGNVNVWSPDLLPSISRPDSIMERAILVGRYVCIPAKSTVLSDVQLLVDTECDYHSGIIWGKLGQAAIPWESQERPLFYLPHPRLCIASSNHGKLSIVFSLCSHACLVFLWASKLVIDSTIESFVLRHYCFNFLYITLFLSI